MARQLLDRRHLRRTPGLRFAKLLGTGHGRTFTPRDADLHRWALFAIWDSAEAAHSFAQSSPQPDAWARLADEHWRAELRPIASRGRWSRRDPFPALPPPAPGTTAAAPVAAITRARLTTRHTATFWRAVPPVAADLAQAPGLRLALGVGEAPIGLQGTFSLWDDAAALRAAVERTAAVGWSAEELFARCAVVGSIGTVDGQDPATPTTVPAPAPNGSQ
nr:monooxygenase [Micromonospora sp. DSM 115978]